MDNQRGGSGGQTQQGQGGARNQPETHGHGPKISSYWTKSWIKKQNQGRGSSVSAKARTFSAADTEGGLKPREGGGGEAYQILGISSTHSWHL